LRGKGLEIQSDDVAKVARFASIDAAKKFERPLIVEDTGLFIDALGGFPGPYASSVFRSIGPEAILRLLGGGEEDEERRATFRSAVAYCEPGGVPRAFRGSILGTIAKRAAGTAGFGFDPIFIPAGHRLTLAQFSIDEKCQISHRAEAVKKFGKWYVRHS
jgi:XTP/dITP diphosphohydrolase